MSIMILATISTTQENK
ncbi:TPA: hypothetical protein ACYSC8_004451 [Citrobacter freundii]|uniref:Uncharacterized protein n=4 Tax=Citrobacter TaxID=544 RepID=A0AAP5XRS8_CITFR|nr:MULTISPECIES: hypothetical protein [Enterobacteriaceae]MDT3756222.1 hypothetical protein [Citrobacter freundii complex sp. 2023EL-00962]MBS9488554.1 hypothetical protein [Citrobacter braakii]MBU5386162.1 hypothetical protein [Citrobacter cronae]MBU5603575.1 hypothetical protein [Citrobacter sp. S55_ASV_140]MBU5643138.1 hypothetical protein [Citrobacter sp. S46_ASV_140]